MVCSHLPRIILDTWATSAAASATGRSFPPPRALEAACLTALAAHAHIRLLICECMRARLLDVGRSGLTCHAHMHDCWLCSCLDQAVCAV